MRRDIAVGDNRAALAEIKPLALMPQSREEIAADRNCVAPNPERHFNHINTKQRRIRILVRSFTRAPSQLFVLTDEGSAGYIDVNVVLIIRIDD